VIKHLTVSDYSEQETHQAKHLLSVHFYFSSEANKYMWWENSLIGQLVACQATHDERKKLVSVSISW
jgi:hypothetical protein